MPDSTKITLKYFLQSFMTKGFVSEIFYAYMGLKRSYNTQLSNVSMRVGFWHILFLFH